jgi:hypothetical protein
MGNSKKTARKHQENSKKTARKQQENSKNSHIFVQKIHDSIENQKINQKYIHPIPCPRLFGKVIQF